MATAFLNYLVENSQSNPRLFFLLSTLNHLLDIALNIFPFLLPNCSSLFSLLNLAFPANVDIQMFRLSNNCINLIKLGGFSKHIDTTLPSEFTCYTLHENIKAIMVIRSKKPLPLQQVLLMNRLTCLFCIYFDEKNIVGFHCEVLFVCFFVSISYRIKKNCSTICFQYFSMCWRIIFIDEKRMICHKINFHL